jgi:probable rRNA maturation factor
LNWEVDITIEETFEEQVSEEWLRLTIDTVMLAESVEYPVELSLLITGDETVHDLNHRYRQMDSTTDVLAFAFQEDTDFPQSPDGISHLGEVIVSYPQANRQATEQGHPLNLEIAILTIHGTLHLLGYDHEDDEDAHVMQAKERKILHTISSRS